VSESDKTIRRPDLIISKLLVYLRHVGRFIDGYDFATHHGFVFKMAGDFLGKFSVVILVFIFVIIVDFDGFTVFMLEDHIKHSTIGKTAGVAENEDLVFIGVQKTNEVIVVGSLEVSEGFDVLEIAIGFLQLHFGVVGVEFIAESEDDRIMRIIKFTVDIIDHDIFRY